MGEGERSRRGATTRTESRADIVAYELAVVGKGAVHSVPWPSDGTLTVGRDARSGLCLDASSVSRQHLVLRASDGRFTVEDVGSANGTILRGERLPTGKPTAISPGDAVYVGDFALIVRGVRGDAGGGDDERLHESPLGSPAMRAVYEHIDSVAPSTINVLILGETGVGKDIVAQALHARSGRKGPLVRVNCAALSASLLESELFGHERGAFTGAHSAKPGLLEVAAGGSAFLDEVGEMPLALQSTLLHAIETREVQRVGSVTPRAVDVRFIAATNRPLEADAASGRFRADLYYRLAGFTIAVPPLRQRREDILPLAEAMLARIAGRAGLAAPPRLDEEAERRLVAHAWPGNARELRNVIERALLLANGRTIDVSHLPAALAGSGRPGAHAGAAPGASDASDGGEGWLDLSPAEDEERRAIVAALAECQGNQSHAARLLGVSRSKLLNRLDALRIARPHKRPRR